MRVLPRRSLALGLSTFLGLVLGAVPAAGDGRAPMRWSAETPDAMVDAAKARALGATSDADAVAAMAVLAALDDRATYGRARAALDAIAQGPAGTADARLDAALLSSTLAPDETEGAGQARDKALGVVTNLALLGPFRDTGGGLAAKDGPEAPGQSFGDPRTRFPWGIIDVAWRTVPPAYATASGVPLDLFIHPRKESCSWLATRVTLPTAQPVVVHLASTGQARLMFDGTEIGRSEDVHRAMRFDRLAARVEAQAGNHLVAVKTCTGALDDDGRVRLRLSTPAGAPLVAVTSPTLAGSPGTDRHVPRPPVPAVRFQRVVTPLERALAAAGAGASPDQVLDAATARTLGGADDLKSPRAPGMLAALAQTKDLAPDTLAMAAWITPSGANRSGWLNLARTRAEAAGDAATRGFVERRLVAEHLNANLSDWAKAVQRGAHLDAAKDDEAILLGALVDKALGVEALKVRAVRALAASMAGAPQGVPTALVRELAWTSTTIDTGAFLAARTELARRGQEAAYLAEASGTRGADAVVAAARRAFAGGLEDADDALRAVQAVSGAGRHEAARDLYNTLVAWAPNRSEAWSGLADELAATAPPAGESAANGGLDGVQSALRRARELEPGDARTREELALRQRKDQGPTGDPRDDERYLVPSATILAKRQGIPSDPKVAPDVADRELFSLRIVVMHADRRVSDLTQYAREIVIPPRTQEELYEDIPGEGDLTEILRARVHHKDGGVAFPIEEQNDPTRPRIRWPELLPGDTVEVVIRSWTAGAVGGRSDPPFYRLDYAGALNTHPLLYNELVIESPPDHPIYVDVLNGKPDRREDKVEGGKSVTRLVWDRPPNVADEPLAPQLTEIVPMTVLSTFKNWSDFRAWYQEAVRGFTEPDDEVKKLARDLTKGAATRADKLAKIFDFVADDIRYVNYVSGEWWLPNRPQQLLARREGDCDDKAMLLITLLRAVGIETQEVMVQTRLTGEPSILSSKLAAAPLFDHGIAFLPGEGGGAGTYLDATAPQSRLGPLPSMDARAVALRMDAGSAEIVHLPASSPDDHGSDVDWTIQLKPDGAGDLVGEEKHIGDGAFWLRSYLTEAGARSQYVEERMLGAWFPTVVVDKQVDFKGDLPQGQAWVRYRARSDGLARHEAGDLVVPLSPSATLASELAPLVHRTLPVSLPPYLAPMHERRTIRIVAPRGYKWTDLPPGGDENGGEFGRAHLDVSRDPRDPSAVVVRRSVVFDQSLIPVEKYAAWRAFIQRVDALMHKSVRLVGEEPAQGTR